MEIITAYFRLRELDTVCEGFDNFAATENYLASLRLNEPIEVVSFIGRTLDECWDGLDTYITHMKGCERCNWTGVLAGKLGGKWTYYPQLRCKCQASKMK